MSINFSNAVDFVRTEADWMEKEAAKSSRMMKRVKHKEKAAISARQGTFMEHANPVLRRIDGTPEYKGELANATVGIGKYIPSIDKLTEQYIDEGLGRQRARAHAIAMAGLMPRGTETYAGPASASRPILSAASINHITPDEMRDNLQAVAAERFPLLREKAEATDKKWQRRQEHDRKMEEARNRKAEREAFRAKLDEETARIRKGHRLSRMQYEYERNQMAADDAARARAGYAARAEEMRRREAPVPEGLELVPYKKPEPTRTRNYKPYVYGALGTAAGLGAYGAYDDYQDAKQSEIADRDARIAAKRAVNRQISAAKERYDNLDSLYGNLAVGGAGVGTAAAIYSLLGLNDKLKKNRLLRALLGIGGGAAAAYFGSPYIKDYTSKLHGKYNA